MKGNRFEHGAGCFTCTSCGRLTRTTAATLGFGGKLCEDDFELAGIYNVMMDEGAEGVASYAAEVRERTGRIVARGGKLGGDAQELLAAVEGK